MKRCCRGVAGFTVLSLHSRFGFRLLNRVGKIRSIDLKSNEHVPEIVQLDGGAILRSMR